MPALVTWMEKTKTHLTVINNQDTDRHIGRLVLIDTLLLYPVPERVNFKGQKIWWFQSRVRQTRSLPLGLWWE